MGRKKKEGQSPPVVESVETGVRKTVIDDKPVRASPDPAISLTGPPGSIEDKHHTRAHAVCSASSSKMWSHCTPSARLQELFPSETTVYAERGTYVHELAEYKLNKLHKKRVQRPQSEHYDDEDAEQNSDLYVEIVTEAEEAMKAEHGEVMLLVEEKVDFSPWVTEGFGSCDAMLCSPGELRILDYKNGFQYVDANGNSQMQLYALGALNAYDFIFDFQKVSMTIVQPNAENISTYTVTKQELLDFGEWIKPRAKAAFEGTGEQVPGDHCMWCRAKPVCEARKAEALALAQEEFLDLDAGTAVLDDGSDEITDASAPYTPDTSTAVFRQPGLVQKNEIERILPLLNRNRDWIESVFAYVSSEAIMHGVHWDGYKIVQGRSKRVFTDIKAVEKAARDNGYTDIYKTEMISLTEMEKLMGKKNFASILTDNGLVLKPPGKLTLVPEDDPREAVEIDGSPSEFDAFEDPQTQLNNSNDD